MKRIHALSLLLLGSVLLSACQPSEPAASQAPAAKPAASEEPSAKPVETANAETAPRLDIYAQVQLGADLSQLSDRQRQMIGLLIDAAKITDDLFWKQVWGDKAALLDSIGNPEVRQFAKINYGPWDLLDNNRPFIEKYGARPPGVQFYPRDMTKQEFEDWQQPGKEGDYSLVRRNAGGKLELVPYHVAYADEVGHIAGLLRQAAKLADDPGFAHYLEMRATAILNDDYRASDMAWMDMKTNPVELVIGPIETYQDGLFGYRASYETFVLLKDQAWSEKLARFARYLPELQRGLPVPDAYKQETPGSDADLNAYDLLYCAGDCNAGGKTIAINLPNDEQVQLAKGTRRLQLKNAMLAKFNKIMVPVANVLIDEGQRQYVTFNSFFGNTMFHEVAHGLGIKNTLDGSGTVRQALKEYASTLEEGKADVLGLYMEKRLREMGEITEGSLTEDYVTFLAGIFRSVRFGAGDAHGQANIVRFNFFQAEGAFTRNEVSGTYHVNLPEFEKAVTDLSNRLLTLQGNGDYKAVADFVKRFGQIKPQLQQDLDRLAEQNIPVDIVYEQGKEELGL